MRQSYFEQLPALIAPAYPPTPDLHSKPPWTPAEHGYGLHVPCPGGPPPFYASNKLPGPPASDF